MEIDDGARVGEPGGRDEDLVLSEIDCAVELEDARPERLGDARPRMVQANHHEVRVGDLGGDRHCAVLHELASVHQHVGEGALVIALVDLSAPGVTRAPCDTLELVRKSARISFVDAPCTVLAGAGEAERLRAKFLHGSAILLAFEGLGGADAAMEMTVGYAQERVAFGRRIGGYQAVKHRCADMYIKNQLARSHAYYGAWALLTGAPELAQAAAGARVAAIDAFQFAAEENVQMHGGIGFTWESDCQFFYRRARLLALSLGSGAFWSDQLVRSLEQRNTELAA